MIKHFNYEREKFYRQPFFFYNWKQIILLRHEICEMLIKRDYGAKIIPHASSNIDVHRTWHGSCAFHVSRNVPA